MPLFFAASVVHESLRASGVPAQSESVSASAGSVHPETVFSVAPLTVVGQQTSVLPVFSRTQPAFTASCVSLSSEQSSLRGVPVFPAQSSSVSAPSFCRHATVDVPPDDDVVDEVDDEVVGVVSDDEQASSPTRTRSADDQRIMMRSSHGAGVG
jgi:hypothetical protein